MRARATTRTGTRPVSADPLADREVQVLDFVGDALLEREGDDLGELGGALGRRLALGAAALRWPGTMTATRRPAARGTACASSPDDGVDEHLAVGVAHHPAWRVAVAQLNDQRFSHLSFTSKTALHGADFVGAGSR